MKLMKKACKENDGNKINFADFAALAIAMFQLIYPFVLISIAVFLFLMWLLTRFWI
jgi:hypothetical protein